MVQVKTEPGTETSTESALTRWPLNFSMQPDFMGEPHWHHWHYRNSAGKRVEVLYSQNKAESEILAQKFLNEPVLGFDMEWPWDSHKYTRLQQKVGLIQCACEDKIGLFHIGLHTGRTAHDLVAPSLRKIIESPTIIKTGVGIQSADYARLEKWFGLKPQGAFELSHLHNLITHGAENPEMINTKLRALAKQVEVHLGKPLAKGSVRTSNWSKPIGKEQRNYAADDAYAGFMLYHRMQAIRFTMSPIPPAPRVASEYLPNKLCGIESIQLKPPESESILTAYQFYKRVGRENDAIGSTSIAAELPEAHRIASKKQDENGDDLSTLTTPLARIRDKSSDLKVRARVRKPKAAEVGEADYPHDLFDLLVDRRRLLATPQGIPAYCVAHNTVLKSLARQQPRNAIAMLNIAGIGKQKVAKYGADFIEVIKKYAPDGEAEPMQVLISEREACYSGKGTILPSISPSLSCLASATMESPSHAAKRGGGGLCANRKQSPQPVILHTGLSFSMASTEIDAIAEFNTDQHPDHDLSDSDDSDDAFGDPLPTPVDSLSKRQRLRSPSPVKESRKLELEPEPKPVAQLSFSSHLYAKKLTAFSKRVAALNSMDVKSIVSEATIILIATVLPKTPEDIHQIPGIATFLRRSAAVNLNLLGFILTNNPLATSASLG